MNFNSNIMKKLFLSILLMCFLKLSFSQSEVIKTNLSTCIKSTLLAPTSFKIHRFSSQQISPSTQKLLLDLKRKEANLNDKFIFCSKLIDSLNVKFTQLITKSDSLKKIMSEFVNIEARKSLEAKIKELDVIVPKDQEFLFWLAERGMDTTIYHLAFVYSNEINNMPIELAEKEYDDIKAGLQDKVMEIEEFKTELALLTAKRDLINLDIASTKELPIYKAYIVYQALTKGGSNSLFEETYYFNKNYKCLGTEYAEFWNDLIIFDY